MRGVLTIFDLDQSKARRERGGLLALARNARNHARHYNSDFVIWAVKST